MDKFEKINNIAFASLYSIMGLSALVSAIFFGAGHMFAIAGICILMVWVLWGEIKQDKKRVKSDCR